MVGNVGNCGSKPPWPITWRHSGQAASNKSCGARLSAFLATDFWCDPWSVAKLENITIYEFDGLRHFSYDHLLVASDSCLFLWSLHGYTFHK